MHRAAAVRGTVIAPNWTCPGRSLKTVRYVVVWLQLAKRVVLSSIATPLTRTCFMASPKQI